MKLSRSLKDFLSESKGSDSYWVEQAKLDFSTSLEDQRKKRKMTYSSIAKKIGTSAAYITKVFRGDSNLTIETMVKLARATGGYVDIRVVDSAVESHHWQLPVAQRTDRHLPSVTAPAATVVATVPFKAANHDSFSWARTA